jgi:hypothetical protein
MNRTCAAHGDASESPSSRLFATRFDSAAFNGEPLSFPRSRGHPNTIRLTVHDVFVALWEIPNASA